MEAFGMSPNGDFLLDDYGNFATVADEYAIAHRVWLILSTCVGEFFAAPDYGIYYDKILQKYSNKSIAEDRCKTEILRGLYALDRGAKLNSISFEIDSKERTLKAFFSATMSGITVKGAKTFA